MAKNFVCHIHKPGVMAAEIRVIVCDRTENIALAEAILAHIPTWPDFELIDVYDDEDKRLLRFDKQDIFGSSHARRN